MTQPDLSEDGKTPLTDDDNLQFKLVEEDPGGLSPAEARELLARPIEPVRRSTQSERE